MIQTFLASLRRKRRILIRNETPNAARTTEESISRPEEKNPREQLPEIARASVQLAELGPRLAAFATGLESQARAQAARASAIASTMTELTRNLDHAVESLRGSSQQVGGALAIVERISQQTRILSINASIEAARAGVHGRAFSVIVDEVQRLADQTGGTTHEIEIRVAEMQKGIAQVESVTGAKSSLPGETAACTVDAVHKEVCGLTAGAESQLESARSLLTMGNRVNDLTESLLLSVGAFRFDAHVRAEAFVRELLPSLIEALSQREQLEAVLEAWLQDNPCFELAYVTDADGRQIVDNIRREGHAIVHDKTGHGRDWSERPWFLDSVGHDGIASTDIYRSAATGDFCFTVTRALREQGVLLGVFGADVSFHRLIAHERAEPGRSDSR